MSKGCYFTVYYIVDLFHLVLLQTYEVAVFVWRTELADKIANIEFILGSLIHNTALKSDLPYINE